MDLLCARALGRGVHAPPQFHLPPTFSVARQRPSTSPLPSALKFFPDVRSGSGPGAGTSLWPERRKGPCQVQIALGLHPRGRAPRRALGAGFQLRGEMRRPRPGQLPDRQHQAGRQNPLPMLSLDPLAQPAARTRYLLRPRAAPSRPNALSRVSAALRERGLLPFKSSRALGDASFVVGFLLPASPPPPPPRVHLLDAGLPRTPA